MHCWTFFSVSEALANFNSMYVCVYEEAAQWLRSTYLENQDGERRANVKREKIATTQPRVFRLR